MAGKFEVYKDKSGGFRFRLKAGNGETIASSESYKTKASALNGVESVKKNAGSDVVDHRGILTRKLRGKARPPFVGRPGFFGCGDYLPNAAVPGGTTR
ncbi:YegP family protein [Pseudarthrobacter sp. Y6]|uniref:YegP family protein n=1 Tax=Pseudarthrobacter sp. Y6 TaxID=3418422 RepID=UPI003CED038F